MMAPKMEVQARGEYAPPVRYRESALSVNQTVEYARPPVLTLSARAAKRISEIAAAEARPVCLRVAVSGGGCSGFQYGFSLDDAIGDDDRVVERDGARVIVDEVSLLYLAGAELDFIDDLMGQSFQINNPNAKSSCGCGTSFSI